MFSPHIPQTGLLFRVGLALTETGGGGWEKLKVGQMIQWPYKGKVFLLLNEMVVFPYFPKYPVSETCVYFFKGL